MRKISSNLPDENLQAYMLLYNIEVGLRELIIECLEAICGSNWHKTRLPSDVLENYRRGVQYQRNLKWSQLIPHHPLYYIDFPDLKKVIDRNDNWKDVFQPIFGRKDILIGTLSELEPIRNSIAHNRKITSNDLRSTQSACDKIVNAIGRDHFNAYVSKCTFANAIHGTLKLLDSEAQSALDCCRDCKPLDELKVWKRIADKWWFDEDYLGCSLDDIRAYFALLEAYTQLPRARGSGHKIERWVIENRLEENYIKARGQLTKLFKP